jgi:hypothetical protein
LQLQANAGVGEAASLGAGLVGNAANLVGQGFDLQSGAGNAYQADSQAQLDEAQQRFEANDMRGWDLLNRYFNFAGWGGGPGTATSSKSSSTTGLIPAVMGTAATVAAAGGPRGFGFWGPR